MKKLFIFILIPLTLWAKPIVFSKLSKTILNTGDTLTLNIILKDSVKHRFIYPQRDTSFGDFLLLKTKLQNDSNGTDIHFKLLFKGIGKDSIPPFGIYYNTGKIKDTIITPTVYTGFVSLVGKDSLIKKIKKDSPQKNIDHDWLFYIVVILSIFLLVTLVIFFVYFIRKKFKRYPVSEKRKDISLKEKVITMLDELNIPDASNNVAVKTYYYELSYILRYFVDGNFGTNTTDMTSSEFIKTLRQLSVDKEDIKSVKENIDRFDMIKYASETGQEKMKNDLDFVRTFVAKYYKENTEEEDESSGK